MSESRFCLQCDDGTLLEHGARDLSITIAPLHTTVPQIQGWHCPVCGDCHFDDQEGDQYGAALDVLRAQVDAFKLLDRHPALFSMRSDRPDRFSIEA